MKSLRFLPLILLMLQSTLWSQTEVSGGIFENETWTLTNSPYIVTGDVVIFPNQVLTIEPGVEVRFRSGTQLEIRDASLTAVGTADARITFTLDADDPSTAQKWKGIVNNYQVADINEITLENIVLEYAETGINYGAGFAYRYIKNAIFRNNDRGVFDGAQGYNWVTITDAEFTDNGIGMEGRMSIINGFFENNGIGFANPLHFSSGEEGGEVINCEFINNDKAVATNGQIITFANVQNSEFTNNNTAFEMYRVDMVNSIVQGSSVVGLYFTKGTVENNFFTNNAIGVRTSMFPFEMTVQNNFISNNDIGVQTDGPGGFIQDNQICDNTTHNAYNNSTSPVDLTNNCWCLNTEDLIAETVRDAFDDVSFGIADFTPFQTDCLVGLVYPGDMNHDGIANAWDLLAYGLSKDASGLPRANASTDWIGQEAEDWSNSFANGLNYKHADANGDGFIDFEDVNVLQQNYGATHSSFIAPSPVFDENNVYDIFLALPDSLTVGDLVQVNILLGEAANPVEDLYGLAFSLVGDLNFFDAGTVNLKTTGSWLGDETNMVEMLQEYPDDGKIDFALTKTDLMPSNGYGYLAAIEFVMSEDIIAALITSGDAENTTKSLNLRLESIEGFNSEAYNLRINHEETTVTITSTNDLTNFLEAQISIQPNPANDYIQILSGKTTIESVNFYHANGQLLSHYQQNYDRIQLSAISDGLYFVEIQTQEGTIMKKVLVERR